MNSLLGKAAPYAVAVLLAGGLKVQYDANLRAQGTLRERLRATEDARDSLRRVKDSLAVMSVAQKETLRVNVVRRIPVLDTVEVLLRDTVPVPVEVVRELVRVDSAVIASCQTALNTCEEEKSALRADLRLTETQLTATRRLIPSGFAKARSNLTAAAVGALACFLLCPKR